LVDPPDLFFASEIFDPLVKKLNLNQGVCSLTSESMT